VPKATNAPQQTASLFDHLVGASKKPVWDRYSKGPGSFEVNVQFVSGGLLYRKLGRIGTMDNLVDVDCSLTGHGNNVGPKARQSSERNGLLEPMAGRQAIGNCKIGNCPSIDIRQRPRAAAVNGFCAVPTQAQQGGRRTLEYVAPCDQYDRDHDYYRYRHLTGDAVENATFFRVTGLHCHNYLLG